MNERPFIDSRSVVAELTTLDELQQAAVIAGCIPGRSWNTFVSELDRGLAYAKALQAHGLAHLQQQLRCDPLTQINWVEVGTLLDE